MSEGVYLNQLLMLTFLRIIQKPLLLDIANQTIFFSFEKKKKNEIPSFYFICPAYNFNTIRNVNQIFNTTLKMFILYYNIFNVTSDVSPGNNFGFNFEFLFNFLF